LIPNPQGLSRRSLGILRNSLLAEFRAQGFKLVDNTLEFDALSKESIRKLNRHAVQFLVEKNKELIEKYSELTSPRYGIRKGI
jgi:hypothetical protein